MAKRLFTTQGLTFTASAAGTIFGAGANYMAIKGGGASQLIDVLECKVSGMTSASTLGGFVLKRISTGETTPATLAAPNSDGGMYPGITALVAGSVAITFISATTQPVPSNTVTDATLDLGLNGFGGILRWNAAPTQEYKILGATAPGGYACMFNSSTALGQNCAVNAHIIYEPY